MPGQTKTDSMNQPNTSPGDKARSDNAAKGKDREGGQRLKKRRMSSAKNVLPIPSEVTPDPATLTPWEAFQEHLRLIDDNSGMYVSGKEKKDESGKTAGDETSRDGGDNSEQSQAALLEQQAKLMASAMKLKSSDAFGKVMYELQLKRQQHLEKMAAMQRERERRAQEELAKGEPPAEDQSQLEAEDMDPDWSDDEDDDDVPAEVDTEALELRKSAIRAWGIIRRRIQEMKMEKKNAGSTMSWSFLRQTLGNMTDMEKGRQNLYERYLNHPDIWREGFVNFPSDLLDKQRDKQNKPGRRQYVAPPPNTSHRPKSRLSQSHKRDAGAGGASTHRSGSVKAQ